MSRGWGAGGRRGGEHRRDVSVPLRRPEQLQGIDAPEDEIIVRCPGLAPARLRCPPFYARPEYRGLVPDHPPATAELRVCHHLWYRRSRAATGRASCAAAAGAPTGSSQRVDPPCGDQGVSWVEAPHRNQVAGESHRSVAEMARCASSTGTICSEDPGTRISRIDSGQVRRETTVESDAPTAEDIDTLAGFVERLIAGSAGSLRTPMRGVHRGDRLVEVRVAPSVALPLCGDPERAHVVLRRWAALRWVRRIRPSFVLERHAIGVLDEPLRRRLSEACARGGQQAPVPPPA
jgi:hypothetical protein